MLTAKIGTKIVPYLSALESEEFYNGSSRRIITMICEPAAINIDDLLAATTEANLQTIELKNNDLEITNILEGFALRLQIGIESCLQEPETPESPAVYADRLVIKIGRRTYIEQMLKSLGL